MYTIIRNIDSLVTCEGSHKKIKDEMKDAKIIENGYVVIEGENILEVGHGEDYKKYLNKECNIIEGKGKTVTPGLIDPHTHVVYGGSREKELSLKLQKVSYIEILKNGGGILSTVRATRNASPEQLYNSAKERMDLMLLHGTTTIESKSGYALDFHNEIKMLNVNKKLNENHPIDVVSTYLGAHAIPEEYKEDRQGYIKLIKEKVVPYVVENKLAEYIDCFCEEGVYTVEEAEDILTYGFSKGLKIKIHADEVKSIGGAELAGKIKANSAEHLVAASDKGIKALADNKVVAVLLPCTSFYLMLKNFARGREMIEQGVPVALATDCNPGTCPTESMQQVMTFACFGMGMLPEEIINAMTINAACAIGREKTIGSIEKGKKADICIFNSKNLDYLIYHFGVNSIYNVIKNGKIVVSDGKVLY